MNQLKSYGVTVSGQFILDNFEASSLMNFMKQFLAGGQCHDQHVLGDFDGYFYVFEATNMPMRLKAISKHTKVMTPTLSSLCSW